VLIYADSTNGNPGILVGSGTAFSYLLTGTNYVYPYIPVHNPATQIPLAALRLSTGSVSIDWDNLYDVRQWVHAIPSGTSAGGAGGGGFISVWDEGIPIGSGTVFNFVGNGVTSTRSGTVINVDIPGGGGGGGFGVAVTNDGIPIGTGTTLDFGSDFVATRSGTVIRIDPIRSLISGTSTYYRVGQPTPLAPYTTGAYWQVPDRLYATGSLSVSNQGHALIIGTDYLEQYPSSGTYQYLTIMPTGTYHLVEYGVPVGGAGGAGGGGGGGQTIINVNQGLVGRHLGTFVATGTILDVRGGFNSSGSVLSLVAQKQIIFSHASNLGNPNVWTNFPAADTHAASQFTDLNGFSQARMFGRFQNVPPLDAARLHMRFVVGPNLTGSVAMPSTEMSANPDDSNARLAWVSGTLNSTPWFDINQSARAENVWIFLYGTGSNGSFDPTFWVIGAEFR
jgi:hypothetical protein